MSGHQNKGFSDDERRESDNSFPGSLNSTELTEKKSKAFSVESKNTQKSIEAGEYDPYLFREVEHPTTNFETLIHLLKCSFGTGILAMPLAYYHSGYLLGIIVTCFIGYLCTHCVKMLVKCEYEVCKRQKIPSMSYKATAEACCKEGPPLLQKCSKYAPHIINMFLCTFQFGTCSVYTVFIGDNIQSVLAAHDVDVDARYVMLGALLPLILINYLRNLKYLAPFATLANIITFLSYGIIAYYMFDEKLTFEGKEAFGDYRNYPLFFGTVLFALEAIGVVMPLENEMKTPQHFGSTFGVLNIGMVSVVTLYNAMGFIGYLAYGKEVGGSISFNIGNDIPAQVCKLMLALSMFVTHAIQMYPAIEIVWGDYILPLCQKSEHKIFLEYLTRTMLVFLSCLLAVLIPYIDLFISLFGALSLSALGLTIPAVLDLSTFWYELKGTSGTLRILKNCFIMLVGIFGLIVGTSTSLQKIIEKFQSESN